jgi:hypothetical protein
MTHLVGVALDDLERTDFSGLWVCRRHAMGRFQGSLPPHLRKFAQRDQADYRREIVVGPDLGIVVLVPRAGTPTAGSALMVQSLSVPNLRTSTVCHR